MDVTQLLGFIIVGSMLWAGWYILSDPATLPAPDAPAAGKAKKTPSRKKSSPRKKK